MKNTIRLAIISLCFLMACTSRGSKDQQKTLDSLNASLKKLHIKSMDRDKKVQSYMDSLQSIKSKLNNDSVKKSVEQAYERSQKAHQHMDRWMKDFHWMDSSQNKAERIKYLDSQLTIIKRIDSGMAQSLKHAQAVWDRIDSVAK